MEKPNIIYEDDYLLVAEKPAGMLSYPVPGSSEKTIGDILSVLPAHRLDRDTSGLIICAKTNEIKEKLSAEFAARQVKKEYLALVWGELTPKKGEIDIPLGRASKDRLKVVPVTSGRPSRTVYQVLRYFPKSDMSEISVKLLTGRMHQIRAHMAAIGHPVVGDPKYSNRIVSLKRQFLHAHSISFRHPETGELISLSSPLPPDLKLFLASV